MNTNCQHLLNSIPYSKIVYDQFPDQDDQDCNIPDQYYIKKGKSPIENSENIITQQSSNTYYLHQNTNIRDNNIENCNTFNRTFTAQTFNGNTHQYTPPKDKKKLTHGLTNYKDIKSAVFLAQTNKDNIKSITTQSNSMNKKHLKLNQQQIYRNQKQLAQCTFTPKTNNNKPPYRSFKQFTDSQDQFVNKKQAKIQKIKSQISEMEAAICTAQPTIDKNSRRMSELAENSATIVMNQYPSKTRKMHFHERLSNLPKKKQQTISQQATFTPKILNKSKQLQRNDRIENLLYQDAQRRKGQQTLAQNQSLKRQSLNKKLLQNPLLEKQSKHNNKLICKKIKSQFLQLLQIQSQLTPQNINDSISPILAITILSQLFNIQLDPNKNQQLCINVLNYLVTYNNDQKQTINGSVSISKFWDFIKAIIVGSEYLQNGTHSFTREQADNINQELGYFYFKRLLKWPTRFQQHTQNQPQYKISPSQRTNKLAQIHRSKKIQQLTQFLFDNSINNNKIYYDYNLLDKDKNKNLDQHTQRYQIQNIKQDKSIKLEELFMLDSIRQKNQLEKKKFQKQCEELKYCTFKPIINEKSNSRLLQKRTKSKQLISKSQQKSQSSNNIKPHLLKTQPDDPDTKTTTKKDSIEKVKKIVNKINTNTIPISIPTPPTSTTTITQKKTKQTDPTNTTTTTQPKKPNTSTSSQKKPPHPSQHKKDNYTHVKDADKSILRCNLARKIKHVQTAIKQRGYNTQSDNWLKQIQEQKKKILGEFTNFLGYIRKNNSKDKQWKCNTRKPISPYQTTKANTYHKFK